MIHVVYVRYVIYVVFVIYVIYVIYVIIKMYKIPEASIAQPKQGHLLSGRIRAPLGLSCPCPCPSHRDLGARVVNHLASNHPFRFTWEDHWWLQISKANQKGNKSSGSSPNGELLSNDQKEMHWKKNLETWSTFRFLRLSDLPCW